jgi:hypothetical protein
MHACMNLARKKIGKREYLNNQRTRYLMKKLNKFFESTVEVPRIKVGNKQTIETLINEETLMLSQFLRNELERWMPRIVLS